MIESKKKEIKNEQKCIRNTPLVQACPGNKMDLTYTRGLIQFWNCVGPPRLINLLSR